MKQRGFPGWRRSGMNKSVLDGNVILAVDDEPDVLTILEEEIKRACPHCGFEKAAIYETAVEMMKTRYYDAVILDLMGVRGFDLLELAVNRNFRTARLTAHAPSAEALKQSREMGARAYLPKEKLGEVVPFQEDVLTYMSICPGGSASLKK
jgi:DNA-binding response OmpR family regulator